MPIVDVNGQKGFVPDANLDGFLKDYPDANIHYAINGQTWAVPAKNTKKLLQKFPDAAPLTGGIETPKDLAIPHDQVGFQGSLTAPDLNPEQGYHPINKTGTPSVVPMPIPSSISDQPIFNQPQEPALKVAPYQNENLKGAESKALVNTAYNNLNSSISKTGEQAYNASGFNKNTHLGSPMSEDAGSLTNAILGIQAYNKSIDPATFIPQKIDELQPYIQNEALQELQNDPNYLNLKNTGQLTPDLQQKLVSDKLAQKTQQAYDTILQKGYIQPNMPTSWADDIIKGAVNQSMIGMGYNLATNVESGSLLAAKQQALKDYNPNIVESALSMAGGFILDSPFFAVGGEVTSAATDAIANQVLKQSTKGLLENGVLGVNPESLARLLSPAEKGIIKGSEYAGQGLTMANYNQAKSDLGQLLDINEGVKSIGDFKPFDVKKYFEDFGMFSMLGFAGGAVYGAAQKAKEAIGGLAGNLTARAIQVGDVAAQSASFTAVSALENPNTHFNAFKDFESNFLMFATMGAQHLIGGVEGVRKPRPENAAQKKMYDFMDNNLKGNNDILNSINFTQEEQNALSPLSKATDLKSAIIDLSNQSVKDKDLAKKVDDLLTNKDVPFSLKSKLYYAISGDMLSIPTIGTHAVIPDNDMYTVEARDRAGNLIEKKPNLSLEDATNIDRDYDEMKKDQDGFMLERSLGNTDAVTNIMKDVAKKEEIPIDDISKIFAKEPKDRTDKERQITQSYISELLKNVKPSKNNILLSDYDNITNAQRKSIVDNYDKSLHNFDDTFGKDAEQMKGQVDSGNYEDYWMTKGQKDAVNKYVKTKKDYDGFLNHVKNNLDKTIEKLHKSIDLLTNKDTGHVTEVKFNGQNYTVSDGKLAISVDENVVKEIDNKNSSDIIALRDVNGNIISASIKDSNLELQSDTDAKELKQSVVDQARNKAVEDIKSSIDYNKGEQLFYTKDGKTTNVTFDQAHPDDDKAIVFDMEKTPKIINGVPQYERMIVDRSMLSTEKIPPVEEEKSTEGTTEIKELPKDDKGNISWNEMTPEEILRTLRSQMDDENVIGSIDETIDKATKELDKVSKKKITGDVDTRMKNIEEKNSKMSSLQKTIDHFNKVKELTTKTNENATKNGKIEQDSIEKHQNGNGIVQENGETGNVAPENSQESTETGDSNSVQKGGEKINTNIDVPDNTPLEDVPFQIISEEEGNKEKTNEQVEKIDQEKAMGNPAKYDQPFKTNDKKNYDTLVGILHRHFPKNNTATAEEFKAAVDKMLTSPRVLILKEMQSIKDNAVKDGTFMKAPNGNDTNLTETQWLQVRTDNFKNWFGDWLTDPEHASKVVDENGEPLVVYHGSPNKFNVFNLDKIGSQGTTEGHGFYFIPDRSISDGYSERRGGGEGSLFSLYLNIRNPYSNEVKTFTKSNIKKILLELYSHDKEALSNFGDVGYEGFNKILNDAVNLMNEDESDTSIIGGLINGGVASVEDVLKAVKKVTKKDGVITSWKSDEKETPIYITIDPTDIKSAIDNNGEFDANNPDIRMQIIGEQGVPLFARTPDGTIYGFVKDGTIYLNPAKMNANTPIHEYGHLWLTHIEKTDPALHARGVELIKDSPYYNQVKNDRNYQGLDETGIVDEALARAIGDKGEQIVNNLGLKDKLKAWISDFWKAISSKFGIKLTPDQLQDLTLDQFTDYANANLLGDDVISENKVETDNKMQIDDLDNPDETYTKDIDKLIEQRAKESERLARILSSEPQRPILNREMGEDALSYAKRVQDAEKTFNKEHAIWNKSRDELSKNAKKLAKKFVSSFPRQDTGESNEDFGKRLKKYLDEVPKEGINQEGGLSIENGKTLLKSINTLFNNGDKETKAVIREFSGDFNRRMETATFNLKKAFRAFAKMSRGDMLKFIDNMEHGKKQDTDILQVYSDQLRATLDKAREAVRGLGIGKLEEFIEYYFPHRYKGKKTDFLKHRNYEYLKDAINAGLEPQDYNPVVSTLKHVRDMYRFVFAHKAMTDLVSTGTVVFVRAGESAPELKDGHFVELPRALSTIYSVHKVEKGRYYALPEVAKIFERYQSRGWEDNSLYRLARGINNIGNQLQLGLSAFHVGFTSLDTIVSRNALALEYLLHGKIGRGLWEMFPLNSLITPATNYYRGKQLQNVFIGKTMADNYKMVVAATGLQMANGRAHMDAIYGDQMWNKMMENLHSKTVGGVLTSIPQGLIAVLEAPGKFIMENIVPRQKLGVFYDMMMYELRVHPNMDVPQFREAAQRAWDSVDNRLGQLTYDNLFWNESVKDALMLTFRSVGWNLGTIREIGGAVLELLHTVSHRPKNDIETHKAAYVASLMFTTAMMSSIYQYLATKKAPSSALDLVAPQNGGVDNFGNPTRSMLPSYMGQIFSAHYYGLNEVANKFSPLLTGIIENIENKDFYGAEIRRSDMELRDIKGVIKYAAQLGWDELKYVLKDVIPLSIKNLQQQQVSPMAQKIAVMFGIKSAITPLNRTAAENELLALYGEMAPQAPKTQDKIDTNDLLYQLRGQYLNSDVQGKEKIREQAIQALKDKTISPIEYKRIIAPINENPLGQLLMSYKITGDQAYENFIGYQTKEERSKTYQIVINKLKKEFVKSSLDKRKNINIYLGNIYNILKDEGIKTQQQAAN